MKSPRPAARRLVRESARQRSQRIIDAALDIMRRDGLRAITHRAVAAEAGVPLAATTYYFRDLPDLLTASFLHWSATRAHLVADLRERALERARRPSRGDAPALARRLADLVVDYVVEQVTTYREDRLLEFAFLHESLRVPVLREAVEAQRRSQLEALETFHRAIGSPQPTVDAEIAHSLLLGLETKALMADGTVDRAGMRRIVQRYLGAVLAVPAESAKRPRKALPAH